MIRSLAFAGRVAIAGGLLALNSLVHIVPLLVVALVKASLLRPRWRKPCDRILMAIASSWIDFNSWMIDHLTRTRVEVQGAPEPRPEAQVLVVSNHQSWVDIPVLQKVFNHRLPLLRFFLKSQLFWVPLLGLAWWALDFPFMKRHSPAQVRQRPELATQDAEATRAACSKFLHLPVAVVNFVEGTRYRSERHAAQSSPYRHLLKPRAGGIAFVLDSMGEAITDLVDVTIVYPDGAPRLVDLFADRVRLVRVHVRMLPVPRSLRGRDYLHDPRFREDIRHWINELWEEKDRLVSRLLDGPPANEPEPG